MGARTMASPVPTNPAAIDAAGLAKRQKCNTG